MSTNNTSSIHEDNEDELTSWTDETTDTDEDCDDGELLDDDDDELEILLVVAPKNENTIEPIKSKRGPKPKLIGKHSLAYDSIFKGKKTLSKLEDEYESEYIINNVRGSFEISEEFSEFGESKTNIDYYRENRLKGEIRNLLIKHTDIDFNAPRRRPSRTDFNAYYAMLLRDLSEYGYTYTEIFIELSAYFSDNYWNMFLWLDNTYSNTIIRELKSKYGLSDIDKIDFM